MTKRYGSGRDKPPRLRLLNEETDAEKYKRLGWDPRKTYEENMGREGVYDRPGEEFDPTGRYENEGAPTQAVQNLAAQGRGEDTEIAHVARGEYVIPRSMQTPELLAVLRRAAAEANIPFETLWVGSRRNSINPNTGAPEFGVAGEENQEDGITLEPPGPLTMPSKLQRELDSNQKLFDSQMRNRTDAISALQNSNVRAFLDTVSETEGNTNYNSRYGKNPPFTDFSQYPGSPGGQSPSGRYQIDWKTYNDVAPKMGITDFSPQSQDLIAAYLLQHHKQDKPGPNALDHLRGRNIDGALEGTSYRWA
jgi:muramidase (phage lysozyme)